MASISIYFRNGDTLTVGSSVELANQAYERIITSKTDFVDMSSVVGLPRIAIRSDDVICVFFNPSDTTSTYWHSASLRANSESLQYQIRARKLSPGPLVAQPQTQDATAASTTRRSEGEVST
jgi:hypothetical protein